MGAFRRQHRVWGHAGDAASMEATCGRVRIGVAIELIPVTRSGIKEFGPREMAGDTEEVEASFATGDGAGRWPTVGRAAVDVKPHGPLYHVGERSWMVAGLSGGRVRVRVG